MMCHHHPSSEILLQYSSGQLQDIHRTMIELHMQSCQTCAQAVSQLESIGGDIIENDLQPTAMSNNAFDRLLDALDDNPASENVEHQETPLSQVLKTLYKTQESSGLNWHWRTKKFAEIQLAANDSSYEAKLIYIKKGMKVPKHTHKGQEITMVMKGAFRDDMGTYYRGDYIKRDASHEHQPIAESDCICLAITTDDLKFTGTFGPILNLFMK